MPEFELPQTIQTTRINELPLFSTYGPLTTTDFFAMWLSAFNKTVRIDANSMLQFFQGSGGGSFTPVVLGDKYLHKVSASEAGDTQLLIPAFAGQSFFLERGGVPMELDKYNILSAGGFELLEAGDALAEDELFLLHLYSLQGGSSSGGTTSTPLIKGVVNVATNTTFDVVNHVNKLIQFRSGSSQVVFTLPDLSDIPDNTIIPIEANITNTVENRITTSGGQLIYMNNVSKTSIYIRPGEVVWLYRGEDGYYIINDFAKVYNELCQPKASYKAGLNEYVCAGQLLSRAAHPRAWEYIQTLGFSLVSDATWSTASATNGSGQVVPFPYRGCFSTGDGSTTFRLPDLRNQFLRGLLTDTGSTDNERVLNRAGGYQKGEIQSHSHPLPIGDLTGVTNDTVNRVKGNYDAAGGTAAVDMSYAAGGAETRPENVGVLWVIKV